MDETYDKQLSDLDPASEFQGEKVNIIPYYTISKMLKKGALYIRQFQTEVSLPMLLRFFSRLATLLRFLSC